MHSAPPAERGTDVLPTGCSSLTGSLARITIRVPPEPSNPVDANLSALPPSLSTGRWQGEGPEGEELGALYLSVVKQSRVKADAGVNGDTAQFVVAVRYCILRPRITDS